MNAPPVVAGEDGTPSMSSKFTEFVSASKQLHEKLVDVVTSHHACKLAEFHATNADYNPLDEPDKLDKQQKLELVSEFETALEQAATRCSAKRKMRREEADKQKLRRTGEVVEADDALEIVGAMPRLYTAEVNRVSGKVVLSMRGLDEVRVEIDVKHVNAIMNNTVNGEGSV